MDYELLFLKKNIKLPSNKKFGFFFTLIFLGLSIYFFYQRQLYFGLTCSMTAVVFLLLALLRPAYLLPLNIFWMRLGLVLGLIVKPITLSLMFLRLLRQ